jgi:putative DNA methylase
MTQAYKKKLIEVAIPLEAINAASAREKSIRHGHPSTLHLWWARRPLAACRAVLFAQLVDDPSSHPDKFPTEEAIEAERKRLFTIIEELVVWENSTNEEVLERARVEIRKSCDGELPPVYDPFSGGCSIPLEAQRLGLPAFGSDLNPVAVMIGKAMIEIPPRFKHMGPVHPSIKERSFYRNADGMAEDVKHYGQWMREKANEEIGHLYPKVVLPKEYGSGEATVVAWLWARTVKCQNPGCQEHTPLLSSFILSTKKGAEAYIVPKIYQGELSFSIKSSFDHEYLNSKEGYKRGKSGIFECAFCKTVTTRDYVADEGTAGRIGKIQTAVICHGKSGRIFLPPEFSPINDSQLEPDTSFLETDLAPNPRDLWCRNFGLSKPKDLFTKRQLTALNTFCNLLKVTREKIENDAIASGVKISNIGLDSNGGGSKAYAEAISIYLAFAINRLVDASSTLATWSTSGFIRFTFARQALPMTWDFAECNVMSNSTGNFQGAVDWVCKAMVGFSPNASGLEVQCDAQTVLLPEGAVISTDPPYYDNIGYADLSDYFYVWLRRNTRDIFPSLVSTISVPKSEELVATTYRFGTKQKAETHFLDGMTAAISSLSKQGSEKFPTAIYYAFKQSEVEKEGLSSTGWATFLQAVISSGYSIVGTWPVRTERAARTIASGTNALSNSVVLVCRKKEKNSETITRNEFIRLLKQELPPAISKLQAANVSPADMPQSAIGPGIGVFSRYFSVLEPDDSAMTVKTALQLINSELDEYLNDLHGDFDINTRFAATWFEQYGYTKSDYGVADNLARARGIAVESVKHAGIIESSAGKVRILKRDELETDWDPKLGTNLSVWECCQHLVREYEEGGETAAAMLIKKMGYDRAEAVKDLAYYLYDICSNKRQDAKEATSYNALIAGWNEITRTADAIHDTDTTRQASLF